MPDPRPSPPSVGAPEDASAAAQPRAVRRRPVRAQHYLWVAGAVLVVAAALQWLGPVLTPFLVGAILAYLGDPLVRRCAQLGIPRGVGTLLTVVLLMLGGLAVVLVVVPLVQAEIGLLARRLPDLADLYASAVAPWLAEHLGVRAQLDLVTFKQLIVENIDSARDLSLQLLAGVRSGGLLLLALVVNLTLIPVVMFYLLRDWQSIVDRIDDLVPRAWLPTVRGTATDIDNVLAEFLRGQMLVMLSLAVYYTIALWAVGLQFALPIGILTGILVFIPYVGYGLGFVLAILAALLQWSGWPGFIAVLAVYGIGQLLENYVLIPYLVGDRIGLHPLAVIFALLAFGQLFGFAGVLLALPASAALLVGLRRLRAAYVESPLYADE